MQTVSNTYKEYLNGTLSLSPKSKIVVGEIEYLGNVIMATPKIAHSNLAFIGGFPSKTCSFELYNPNNDIDLVGKEIEVYRGLVINEVIEWVKQGVFIPQATNITNDITTKKYKVSNALDKRQLLDVLYESSLDWSTTHTGLEIVNDALKDTGITLESEVFNWATYSFEQPNFPSNASKTEVISRIAEIGGEIALINRDGNLSIKGQTPTGDTIETKRYSKLTKENVFEVNTLVLGKTGAEDNIVYPTAIDVSRVEFVINDNPYVDLNRETMIELVAPYIIGKSYIPFELTDFVDGFIYDLNDVLNVVDKNGETFEAVILDYNSLSRIKSRIGAATNGTNNVNYKIAGSVKEQLANVRLEVDHINNEIRSIVEKGYVDENDLEVLRKSLITQTDESITMTFTTLTEIMNSANSDTQKQFQEIKKYMQFDGGITFGEVGNEVTLRIDNKTIHFSVSDVKIMEITPNGIVIEKVKTNELDMGDFAFIIENDGSLSLV